MIDLGAFQDETRALPNPHKGWYHHYPDNHIDKYRIGREADLLEFPGMDHLYIRLAWAYLEPAEGQFNWPIIDGLIDQWTGHGLGIAFRISCRETSTDRVEQQYATPLWVKEAGAQGGYYLRGQAVGPEGPWEPVFDDPVFLAKLEQFLAAFARRYDGRPWLRYVDIGSVGDWGEGHTWSGSRTEYGYAVRRRHIDLHRKYFKRSPLVVTDDFVYGVADQQDRRRLHEYVIASEIGYRDDSILVDGYFAGHSQTWTVRSPEFFADAYRRTPTVLELEHYRSVKRLGNWEGRPGSALARYGGGQSGPEFLRRALGLLHASYLGYHGDARDWLNDNPELTVELLNRCGYWYFLQRAELPDPLAPGASNPITLVWENRGVAPAYHPFALTLRLVGPADYEVTVPSGNLRWLPSFDGQTYAEDYPFELPSPAPAGEYSLKVKLYSPGAARDVRLALTPAVRDPDGYYQLGKVRVSP